MSELTIHTDHDVVEVNWEAKAHELRKELAAKEKESAAD